MQTTIPIRAPRTHQTAARSDQPLRVLIVDDSPEERRRLAEMLLQACGAHTQIRECDSGLAALAILRRERMEVVLIDYMLPDRDGLELVSEIADMVDDTAVILLGGTGNERVAADSIKHGARDYLVKRDLNKHDLHTAVIAALRTARLEWRHVQMVQQLRQTNDQLTRAARSMTLQVSDSLRGIEESYQKLKAACMPAPYMLGRFQEFERHLAQSREVLKSLAGVDTADADRPFTM